MQEYKFALGSSMLPVLKPADLISSYPANIEDLKIGDLIVYNLPDLDGSYLLHRVIYKAKDNNFVLTKGDNALSLIQKVLPEFIIGKVAQIKRGKKVYNLNTLSQRVFAYLFALLSRYNLTPYLIKKRFLEPVVLPFIKMRLVHSLRKNLYNDVSFFLFRQQHPKDFRIAWRLKAILNQRYCGQLDVYCVRVDARKISLITNLYIRYRDRNNILISRFINKASSLVEANSSELYVLLESDYISYTDILIRDGFVKAVLPEYLSSRLASCESLVCLKKNNS